jgi:tol-pal system protein YbgF
MRRRRLLLLALAVLALPGCEALFGDFPRENPPEPPPAPAADAAKVAESLGAPGPPSADEAERRLARENEELTRRLASVEAEMAQLRDAFARAAVRPREDAAAAPAVPASPSPVEAYAAALAAFRARRYDEALRAFTAFGQRFADHPLALNAQYWVGECRYAQRDFPQAIVEFERVLARPDGARKAPDALLMIGQSWRTLGERRDGDGALRRLVGEYPHSPAAAVARRLLAR